MSDTAEPRRRRNPPSMLLRTGAQLRDRVKARAEREGVKPAVWGVLALEERLRNPAPLVPSAPLPDQAACDHPEELRMRAGPSTVCRCGATLSLTG